MKLILVGGCFSAVANAWTYGDIGAWPTEAGSALCASTIASQSPIDIITATGTGATTDPLVFQGFPDSGITPSIRHELVINDHTWELEWDVDKQATDVYGVKYNEKIYKLKQFHFHSPSEHALDGQHFDMEAHMVHACYGNSSCDTINEDDENLVVAIWMNVGDVNPYLASFWPELATLASNESATKILQNLANPYNGLVPQQPHDFYRYMGSTTTPACVQNVSWFLMSNPVTLSQEQLTSYRTAISNHNDTQTAVSATAPVGVTATWDVALGTNNRPFQVIGDRLPQKYTSPAEEAQDRQNFFWHGLAVFLGCVAVGLCCLLGYQMATKPKQDKKRAVKPPAKKKPPPVEQEPLMTPAAPQAPVPMFQPLQVPTTYAAPMQSPQFQQVQMQPQLQQVQMQSVMTVAPQARPFMVAP